MKNPGFRSLILRSDAVDLGDTIRRDIRDVLLKYDLEDPISSIKTEGLGGPRNFKALDINEGQMVFGGMNRPGRVLGTSYNAIACSQLEQFTEKQFQMLLTRCAGDCPGWYDDEGNNRGMFIADCNPAPDTQHWIKKYGDSGKIKIVNFTFDDNPLYFRKGERTQVGETVIKQLDDNLVGLYHDLYFKGMWVDIAGKLFTVDDSVHLVDEPKDLNNYIWYRGLDFGISAPSVCVWLV